MYGITSPEWIKGGNVGVGVFVGVRSGVSVSVIVAVGVAVAVPMLVAEGVGSAGWFFNGVQADKNTRTASKTWIFFMNWFLLDRYPPKN